MQVATLCLLLKSEKKNCAEMVISLPQILLCLKQEV